MLSRRWWRSNEKLPRNVQRRTAESSTFFFLFHHAGSERRVIREGLNFHPRCMNAWRWSKFSCKFQMTTEIGKERGEEGKRINCIDATTPDTRESKINAYDETIGCNSSSFVSSEANATFRTASGNYSRELHAGAHYFVRVQPRSFLYGRQISINTRTQRASATIDDVKPQRWGSSCTMHLRARLCITCISIRICYAWVTRLRVIL